MQNQNLRFMAFLASATAGVGLLLTGYAWLMPLAAGFFQLSFLFSCRRDIHHTKGRILIFLLLAALTVWFGSDSLPKVPQSQPWWAEVVIGATWLFVVWAEYLRRRQPSGVSKL